MAYFSKPEKGRIPPTGMPRPGDVGFRPGNVIIPSYRDMYDADISPYHRNFRYNPAALEVAGGKAWLHPEYKSDLTGNITDTEAKNINFYTETPELGGVLVRTNSCYAIVDSIFKAVGNGRNDFIGNGAMVMTDDYAQAIVRNCKFETTGCVRPCTAAGLESVLKVYESSLLTHGGQWPEDYVYHFAYGEGVLGHHKGRVDPESGMGGNCRPHMSLNNSKTYFYDTEVISDGWAALSTDSVAGRLYLEANRCNLKVLYGGYATWADTGSNVVYNDCDVNCAGVLFFVVGEAAITVNHSRCVSGLYGVNMNTNGNDKPTCVGQFNMIGGSFHVKSEAVRVASQNAYVYFKAVDLQSENSILLHSYLNKRPRTALHAEGTDVYGVKAVFEDMELHGDILHEDPNRTMAVTFRGTKICGRIQDAYISLEMGSSWYATADSFVGLAGAAEAAWFDAPTGVEIHAIAAGECLLCGTYSLKSGGKLIVK